MRLAPAALAAAACLLAACGGPHGPAKPLDRGSLLYLQNCLACHQANGEGVPGVQPPLAGTPVPNGPPEEMLAWVMYGVRPATLPKGQYSGVMPQFAYLPDADLAALVTHVRTSFGNSASPVTPDLVRQVRAAHAK